MAKFSSYSAVVQALTDDLLLLHADADNAEHTITFDDLVSSVETLFNRKLIVNIITGTTTLDDAYEAVVANSGSAMDINLPLAATYPGQQYVIVNKGAGVATVKRTGGDNISAGTGVALAQWESVTVVSDGVNNWLITATV